MKSENLTRAYQLYSEYIIALRTAHTDAVDAENEFAEILIYTMLQEVSERQWRLRRMAEAAK